MLQRVPARRPEPRRVVICNWRDEHHPEGGGSERYVGEVARRLAAAGDDVTVLCARYAGSRADEVADGVRYLRAGGHLTVFPRALLRLPSLRPDIVVDVQNGVPFGARLVARGPVVVLVHHVHREQWPVATGWFASRLGWWIESRLSPWLNRGCPYVAVSQSTRDELAELGVDGSAITVVHNGVEPAAATAPRAPEPRVCVVGRLVPHKQVEHAIEAVRLLRNEFPGLGLDIVGDGHWRPALAARVRAAGLGDVVTLHGYVDQRRKHELLASSWVHLCPSLKEGWGLVVVEAGTHAVPTIAYRASGGVTESVVHGRTGVLVDDQAGMVDALRYLLTDHDTRRMMSEAAHAYASEFSWTETAAGLSGVLQSAGARPSRTSSSLRRRLAFAVDHERLVHRLRGALRRDETDGSRHRDQSTDHHGDDGAKARAHASPSTSASGRRGCPAG